MTHIDGEDTLPLGIRLFRVALFLFVLGCLIVGFVHNGWDGFMSAAAWLIFGALCVSPRKGKLWREEDNFFPDAVKREKANRSFDLDPMYKMYCHNMNHHHKD